MSGSTLRVGLRASPILTFLTLGVFGAAAAALLAVLPPVAGGGAAILLAVLAVFSVWERTLLRAKGAPLTLELGRDAGILVRMRGGAETAGSVSARRYVSRWMVVLELVQGDAKRRTILVARDMLGEGDFRHLRLWALWGAIPPGGAGAGP